MASGPNGKVRIARIVSAFWLMSVFVGLAVAANGSEIFDNVARALPPPAPIEARPELPPGVTVSPTGLVVSPATLTLGDLDGDGVLDLVTAGVGQQGGVVRIYHGNVDALYPQPPGSRQLAGEAALAEPFIDSGSAFRIDLAPDLSGTGDFDADGSVDIVLAAVGESRLLILRGDGRGGLVDARFLQLSGSVRSLAIGDFNRRDGLADMAVGIDADGRFALVVLESPEGVLRARSEEFEVDSEPRSIVLGRFDEDRFPDVAVACDREVVILRGRDRRLSFQGGAGAAQATSIVTTSPLPFSVTALAAGDLQGDSRDELVLLSDEGALYLLGDVSSGPIGQTSSFSRETPPPVLRTLRAATGLDPQLQGAPDATSVLARRNDAPSNWSLVSLGEPRISTARASAMRLSTGRVLGRGRDDLIIHDPSGGPILVIPVAAPLLGTAEAQTAAGSPVELRLSTAAPAVALVPARLNADALQDLVYLAEGELSPHALYAPMGRTYTVVHTADSGPGSLREAMTLAEQSSGSDTIVFDIPTSDNGFDPATGTYKFRLQKGLPRLNEAVLIDGMTQPGFEGRPLLELDFSQSSYCNGFEVLGGSTTIRGFIIHSLTSGSDDQGGVGVAIQGSGGNIIEGNYFGTDAAGIEVRRTAGNSVQLADSHDNTIGGTTVQARNVLSGNGRHGVLLFGSDDNRIQGNFIGTNRTGRDVIPDINGISVSESSGNLIGGTTPYARNIIAGHLAAAIAITADSSGTLIQGNFIGTDWSGTLARPNGSLDALLGGGVSLSGPGNTVGGTTAGAGNLVSGNGAALSSGIVVSGETASGTLIQGNFIGTNLAGDSAIPNGPHGVFILNGASNTVVGGSVSGSANLISGNSSNGLRVDAYCEGCASPHDTVVQGNLVGTDRTGMSAVGNTMEGVLLSSAVDTVIGGSIPGVANLLSGNQSGVTVVGSSGTRIQRNLIGTDRTGSAAIGNYSGLFLTSGSTGTTVGGTGSAERNVISGNTASGVLVAGADTEDNVIQGNYIGTAADGLAPLGNGSPGVSVALGARGNTIGGTEPGAGNRIAYNGRSGVALTGEIQGTPAPTETPILSNAIYGNDQIGIDLGNDGVTANDPADVDNGANSLQNFPVITKVSEGGIEVDISTTPNTVLRLEFFASAACDPSGFGEGERLVGNGTLTTDAAGEGSASFSLDGVVAAGEWLTATGTSLNASGAFSNTSEFSACFQFVPPGQQDGDADGVSDAQEDGAPHNGDGNGDGVPDSQQAHVTSLLSPVIGDYVTLAAPAGTTLVDVRNEVATEAPPQGVELPLGLLSFKLRDLPASGLASVDLLLPPGVIASTYFKWGPTDDDPSPHWYEFDFDGSTGAVLERNSIHLIFRDGERGDDDRSVNGEIAEPGGPALRHDQVLRFAHFGDGVGQLFSEIILFNPDDQHSASVRLDLKDDLGVPLQVDLAGQEIDGAMQTTIPPAGVRLLRTDGQGALRVGSVTAAASLPVSGVIVFGGATGVAGVGSSAELSDGLVAPVETNSISQVNTGVALMNLETVSQDLVFEISDSDGQVLARAQGTIAAKGHLAKFVTEAQWDEPIDFSQFRGLLTVRGSGRLAGTVIQTRPGELATMPVVALTATNSTSGDTARPAGGSGTALYFAHFGDGLDQLFSQILLMNLSPLEPASAELRLAGDTGAPLEVDLDGSEIDGETSVVIPGGGLKVLETDGKGPLRSGSVVVSSEQPLAGVVLFGGVVGVAGVGSSSELQHGFATPIQRRQSAGINTGIAVMNLEGESIDLELWLTDGDGVEVGRATAAIAAHGHLAKFIHEFPWDRAVNLEDFTGLLRVRASGTMAATAIQTRPDQFATLPVAELEPLIE